MSSLQDAKPVKSAVCDPRQGLAAGLVAVMGEHDPSDRGLRTPSGRKCRSSPAFGAERRQGSASPPVGGDSQSMNGIGLARK